MGLKAQHTVLVVGSGGREHAIAWALRRSPQVRQIYVAPGNAGTANIATNVDIPADDIAGLATFAQANGVTFVVVGPEVSLAAGLVDAMIALSIPAFGPTRAAAQLEASKAFAKDFMRRHHIPTGDYQTFTDYEEAADYVTALDKPVVIKADGLAAGKGVLICDDAAEAQDALQQILVDRAFGDSGDTVLVEERLAGPELSVLAFSDGNHIAVMPCARDHKRVYDDDQGPNTGGMGAFAPAPGIPASLLTEIRETVLQPTIDGMAAEGTPYVGVLYAGLMLTDAGPKVLEFNCRFGDPETQVILPLLATDLMDIFIACVENSLNELNIQWHDEACATIVLASPGYPGSYPKGLPICGLDQLEQHPEAIVFHAGTAQQGDQVVTAGGRVLAVSATGA
ncbi:MAG: phosphoribosylamine--glycine ligase, partial [Anaerolineae bacterium]|nr:phosphoribosylamine--glycine ligase [Anaerolineae bacterium]